MPVINSFLDSVIVQIINPIILLLSAGAFVVLAWGIFEFIWKADDDKARETGRRAILWGFVGLAIIFGAYGIINTALGAFNIAPVTKVTQTQP